MIDLSAPGPHDIMMPADPMDRLLDGIRDIVADLRPGQSICIYRTSGTPKPGEALFTIYTQGTVTLNRGEIIAQEPI